MNENVFDVLHKKKIWYDAILVRPDDPESIESPYVNFSTEVLRRIRTGAVLHISSQNFDEAEKIRQMSQEEIFDFLEGFEKRSVFRTHF